ncbi:hypothetical protein ACSBR1_001021 [Camellia fascicularis]
MKVFIFAPWANGFTHIGQHFEGGASEFRNVLRKYAVECGFQIKFVKNNSVRVTTTCAMNESKACTWAVHGRKLEANGFFFLRKWNSEHICGIAVRTSTNPLVGSKLVVDIIAERVWDRPLTRPTEVILDLKQDYGLDITYRVAWLGIEKARANCSVHTPFRLISCVGIVMSMYQRVQPLSSVAFPRRHVPQRALQRVLTCRHREGWKPRFVPFILRSYGLREHRKLVLVSSASHPDEHAFCLQHLQRNLRDWLCYSNSMHQAGLVWEARNLQITRMVDSIRTKLVRKMAKRRDASQTWTSTICPKMESGFEKAFNEGRSWKVSQSNVDVYEVHSFPSVTVDIGQRTCSCFKVAAQWVPLRACNGCHPEKWSGFEHIS